MNTLVKSINADNRQIVATQQADLMINAALIAHSVRETEAPAEAVEALKGVIELLMERVMEGEIWDEAMKETARTRISETLSFASVLANKFK